MARPWYGLLIVVCAGRLASAQLGPDESAALPSGALLRLRGWGVIAASPNGALLANIDGSEAIRLVDAERAAEQRVIHLSGTRYTHLAFSPDGQRLAGGGDSGDEVHVALWNVGDGELVYRWNWPKGRDLGCMAESLSFSSDGSRLAAKVFRQSKAYLWNLTTGQQIAELSHNGV